MLLSFCNFALPKTLHVHLNTDLSWSGLRVVGANQTNELHSYIHIYRQFELPIHGNPLSHREKNSTEKGTS